ncbi:hypothetical protein [Xylella taiwanensis]|uniref:hypothetical protein n=1 Tax=Xylella taiwanensis TaxID=1444770 RepID=UPI00135F19C9|nr:hypothetical protein [Xylella taiwanensis]MCD8455317.1 hypothetical protein [Xylella taiwanensis]MCD8457722.1 hypothetical protein [Xylella taiwanensis]MCD8464081.1 hypothetical protein [Xylella taiwanensis]UFN20293.1 hypothetical protein LPH58_11120 [Xylella taiwanensis]UFS50315.1 hypothetical protein LPH54_04095 [Xylella taiwanensis]
MSDRPNNGTPDFGGRISTGDQSVVIQIEALSKAECHRVFTEVLNSKKTERSVLQ